MNTFGNATLTASRSSSQMQQKKYKYNRNSDNDCQNHQKLTNYATEAPSSERNSQLKNNDSIWQCGGLISCYQNTWFWFRAYAAPSLTRTCVQLSRLCWSCSNTSLTGKSCTRLSRNPPRRASGRCSIRQSRNVPRSSQMPWSRGREMWDVKFRTITDFCLLCKTSAS